MLGPGREQAIAAAVGREKESDRIGWELTHFSVLAGERR